MSHFIKHSFTMLRGAVLAQLIPVALLPVISRLYGPEAYGVFASVLAVASILAVIGSLRLEVAIVLPPSEDEANTIQRACVRLAGFVSLAVLAVFILFHGPITTFLNMQSIGWWICAAPAIAFFMTLNQIGGYAATRHHDYSAIASSTVRIQLVNGVTAVALGLMGAGAAGLTAARLMGQAGGLSRLRSHFQNIFAAVDIKGVIQRNKKFPLFNLPYSLIGSFTREFIILALTAFQYPVAAGFYGMARAAMLLPVSLVASSLSQVFFREAARSIDHPDFANFAFRLMITTGCLAAPAFALFTIWDVDIFRFVFGPAWTGAGIYATYFAPVAVLFMMSSWPERVFEVRGRQELTLMLQVIFDGASVVMVIFALNAGYPPLQTVTAFVAIQCLYHLSYIAFVFKLLGIAARRFALLMCGIALAAASPYILDAILRLFIDNPLMLFVLETALIGAACLAGLVHAIKTFNVMPAFVGNSQKAG